MNDSVESRRRHKKRADTAETDAEGCKRGGDLFSPSTPTLALTPKDPETWKRKTWFRDKGRKGKGGMVVEGTAQVAVMYKVRRLK